MIKNPCKNCLIKPLCISKTKDRPVVHSYALYSECNLLKKYINKSDFCILEGLKKAGFIREDFKWTDLNFREYNEL